jgi:hypothetical protein
MCSFFRLIPPQPMDITHFFLTNKNKKGKKMCLKRGTTSSMEILFFLIMKRKEIKLNEKN